MTKFRKILSHITLAISLLIGLATIFAAYSGHINPNQLSVAPIMCMLFPYWLIATLALIPICFIIRKWLTLIPVATLICCIGPILNYCPLNFTPDNERNGTNSFTLLSYNAYNFIAHNNNYPEDKTNATLSYIIDTDADIVCLQECEYLSPIPRWHVYRSQVDSIKKIYPHRIIGAESGQSIFSKFPVKEIFSNGYFSHFNVKMPNSCYIDIIDVHLKSISLSSNDKKQYNETITNLIDIDDNDDDNDIASWRNILSKVVKASRNRASQAIELRNYLNGIDNENIIVCGDFNDVPGCFAINEITNDEFDDVYEECGFGPMVTYHGDNLYFRIDHIFYKGDFDAISFKRSNIDCSDHYPMFTTFDWDD